MKDFVILILGIVLLPIAFFVFGETEFLAPGIITLGIIAIIYSLIKLSKKHQVIKDFFMGLLEFI